MTMNEPMEVDPQEPGRLRDMYEQAARERAEAQAELAKLKSRELFRDAGFDLNSRQHQAFLRGYDGDLTAEAVTQYADELGLHQPPPDPQETAPTGPPRDEMESMQRIAEVARDSHVVAPQPDGREDIRRQMEDRARHGATKQELDNLSEQFTRAGGYRTLGDWENR